MRIKKLQIETEKKYNEKIRYILKVVRSCQTEEQVKAVKKWAETLFHQWRVYEAFKSNRNFDSWLAGVSYPLYVMAKEVSVAVYSKYKELGIEEDGEEQSE